MVAKAGDKGTPNLKGLEIINRCPELKKALDAAGNANIKNTYLKRAFSRAWQLLAEQTTIAEDYVDVKFPTYIPTTGTLKNRIYIQHNGRKKKTAEETE